jgi:hypothetical protein
MLCLCVWSHELEVVEPALPGTPPVVNLTDAFEKESRYTDVAGLPASTHELERPYWRHAPRTMRREFHPEGHAQGVACCRARTPNKDFAPDHQPR